MARKYCILEEKFPTGYNLWVCSVMKINAILITNIVQFQNISFELLFLPNIMLTLLLT